MTGRPVLAAAVLAFGGCAAGQDLTVQRAVEIALRANRTLQNANLQSAVISDRKASLKTQFLPSARIFALGGDSVVPFDVTLQRGVLGVDSASGPIPASTARISTPARPAVVAVTTVTQPISGINTIRKGLTLLNLQKESADEQVRLERQTLIRDVRQLYYQTQTAHSGLEAAHETVRLFQEVERITARYAEQRQVLDVEFLEAQLHLAKATASELELQDQEQTLKQRLNQKLGRDVRTEFDISELPDEKETASPDDAAQAEQRALQQRPEVKQADLTVRQAQTELRLTNAAFQPSIAAEFVEIEIGNLNSVLPRRFGIAGVSLAWEPFNWGRRKDELAVRRFEIEQAVNYQKELTSGVQIQVADQLRKLQLAAARLHVASLGRQVAAESLRVAKKQYEVEFTILRAVLQAQSGVESANADYQKALGELWSARADYALAEGQDQ